MFKTQLIPKLFVACIMAMILIDAWPTAISLVVKRPVAAVLDLIGLRQGSWTMFTPNPVINNRWITAEVRTKDGQMLTWDSPLWVRASVWDKFVQFRHVNYYNRIFQSWCSQAAYDFMDYRMRQCDEEPDSIQMHINRMNLVMPEDGSLPKRDEAEWSLTTEPWIREKSGP